MSWRGLSVFGLLLVLLAAMMLVPAVFVLATDGSVNLAWAFIVSAVMTGMGGGLFLIATYRRVGRSAVVDEFGVLLAALLIMPAAAAIPMALTVPYLPFEAVYFEMVSTFTTTGASVFDDTTKVHPAIHLWRGMTAWLGGFIALIMAYALLAPRNLGGFEVRADLGRSGAVGRLRGDPKWAGGREQEAAADRVASAIRQVTPVYVSLTGGLFVLLVIAGADPLVAVISAMSTLSTSGVQPVNGPVFAGGGFAAEAIVFVFLIMAVTRHTYGSGGQGPLRFYRLPSDPEMRILVVAVLGVSGWLFLRHWIGILDLEAADPIPPITAFWGALFTALSFATTTGFESADWDAARMWSGLENTSLVLFGLVIMGGGVATTAGGVKLLRAYALFKHGTREMERLVRPSSISGSGSAKRGLRREGAQIAWVFVMLFLVALALTLLALSVTGLAFEPALAASIAALSNTGPIFTTAEPNSSWLTSVSAEGRAVLIVAMVLGRVELLALIAMLNADNWR
ncbi:MAG: potassium transporter TrkG [Pseudomonadota bacterium]